MGSDRDNVDRPPTGGPRPHFGAGVHTPVSADDAAVAEVQELVAASSLGTPSAQELQHNAPDDAVARTLERAGPTPASAVRRRGRSSAKGRGGAGAIRSVTADVSAYPDLFAADLTSRQQKILEFIRGWVQRFGYPPSVREIGEAVGLVSPSSVARQLEALERKGYLRRNSSTPRSADVPPPSGQAVGTEEPPSRRAGEYASSHVVPPVPEPPSEPRT